MPFEYRLEVLLNLQRSLEHQEENRLMMCAGRVAQLKLELERMRVARMERKRHEILGMEKGVAGIVVQMAVEWDEAAQKMEIRTGEQLEIAEKTRLEQTMAYKAARQKRELLEGLKERLETVYDSEELRHIQQGLDDTFLLRTFFWKGS